MTVYDISIAPARIHGSPQTDQKPESFRALRDAVKDAAAAGAHLSDAPDRSGRMLYLMDMEIYPRAKYVVFVWTLADPSAAAQVYMKRGRASLRAAQKEDDEDVAISSHLVVDFDVAQGVFNYPAGLEDHEGISRSRIQFFLQQLIQDYMPDVVAILDEGITKQGRPKLLMTSHQGKIIDGTNLKPMEIDLVRSVRRQAMIADDGAMYYEASERRVFKLAREGTAKALRAQVVGFVTKLRRQHPNHIIRVRWRDPSERDSATEVTQLDPMERPERLLERALTRTEYLDNFRGLPDATDVAIARLTERMLDRVREVSAEDRRRR